MRTLINLFVRIMILLLVMFPTALLAQWHIPDTDIPDLDDLEDVEMEDVLAELASLALGVDEESPLTTSLDDAKTEVPFLDDFNPQFCEWRDCSGGRTEDLFRVQDSGVWMFEVTVFMQGHTVRDGEMVTCTLL